MESLFPGYVRRGRDPLRGVSLDFMRAAGCRTCPLRSYPKAHATGAFPALVYMLGEAPGKVEAENGIPFTGPSGDLLRQQVPRAWRGEVRFNNVVQSHPPIVEGKQRAPTAAEIAHCSGYLLEDLVATQPRAVFGFGNTPLAALTTQTGISKFAGRRMPVVIGGHPCWYFPFLHPAALLHTGDVELGEAWKRQIADAFAILPHLPQARLETPEEAREGIQVSTSLPTILQFLATAQHARRVGIDYETNKLRPYGADSRILTVAVALPQGTLAFPLDHRQSRWTAEERMQLIQAIIAMLESQVHRVAHNAAFELEWSLAYFGVRATRPNYWGCSLAQAFLRDARPRAHSLDFLCQLHFGLALKDLSNLDRTKLDAAELLQVCHYNGLDAKYHLKLYAAQEHELNATGMQAVYDHHMARIASLVRGQYLGLPVDAAENQRLASEYAGIIAATKQALDASPDVQWFESMHGRGTFNGSSPKHLQECLHHSGVYIESTEEEKLAATGHPLAKLVLDWRGANKIYSTYIKPLAPVGGVVVDGRLHPVINTTYTRTWRTAGEEPNIQNWPQHDENRRVRKQIVALPGHWLVSVDYSSMQARNVAMESRDRKLVQAFFDHYDIHTDWSRRVQALHPPWAKRGDAKALRQLAKNKMVFPLFFGAQPMTVASGLGVPMHLGDELFAMFWQEFPEIHGWQNGLRRFYRENHYVTGLSGFRRMAPITDNMLINTPIQSDEALLVCDAMNRLAGYEDPALQPVMEVHDDLTFMVPEDRFDAVLDTVLSEMLSIQYPWINVPLGVEVAAGLNWFDKKHIGNFESTADGYIELEGKP